MPNIAMKTTEEQKKEFGRELATVAGQQHEKLELAARRQHSLAGLSGVGAASH